MSMFQFAGHWAGESQNNLSNRTVNQELIIEEISPYLFSYALKEQGSAGWKMNLTETGFIRLFEGKAELTLALPNGTVRVEQSPYDLRGTVLILEFESKRIAISESAQNSPIISKTRRVIARNQDHLVLQLHRGILNEQLELAYQGTFALKRKYP